MTTPDHVPDPDAATGLGADAVADVVRAEYGRVVAGLIRRFGDIGLAEDALVEAIVIALDEDGTTASAATAVMVQCAAVAEDTPPRQFVADRPFLFVVRDSCSGSILFLGDVQCP